MHMGTYVEARLAPHSKSTFPSLSRSEHSMASLLQIHLHIWEPKMGCAHLKMYTAHFQFPNPATWDTTIKIPHVTPACKEYLEILDATTSVVADDGSNGKDLLVLKP